MASNPRHQILLSHLVENILRGFLGHVCIAPPTAHRQAVELGEGLLLDEFGGDFHGYAALGEDHGAEHGDGSGFAGLAVERGVGHVGQPRVPVANIDPDAVLRDQLLGVGLGEQLQLSSGRLLITLDRVDCPVQRRAGRFLGGDADHTVHRVALDVFGGDGGNPKNIRRFPVYPHSWHPAAGWALYP